MTVNIVEEIGNVEYVGNEQSLQHHAEVVKILRADLGEILFISGTADRQIDNIKSKETGAFGYAFAIGKLDKSFITILHNGCFRYKHEEVCHSLEKIITKFQMSPTIYYIRKMGMFIYNIFFQGEAQ